MNHPVDMLAVEEERRTLSRILPAVQAMGADMRNRSILALASRFARLNDMDETTKLLGLLTPDYVQTVLPQEMAQDPLLAELAKQVATSLVRNGVASPTLVVQDAFRVSQEADA